MAEMVIGARRRGVGRTQGIEQTGGQRKRPVRFGITVRKARLRRTDSGVFVRRAGDAHRECVAVTVSC
jgi:hypothetical protein